MFFGSGIKEHPKSCIRATRIYTGDSMLSALRSSESLDHWDLVRHDKRDWRAFSGWTSFAVNNSNGIREIPKPCRLTHTYSIRNKSVFSIDVGRLHVVIFPQFSMDVKAMFS